MAEKQIQNEILRVFGARPDMRLWRANVGMMVIDGRPVRFGIKGQADLTGILAGGRRLEIEVKSPTGKQSEDQRNFQAMIERQGGLYILARSVQDVEEALEKAKEQL